MNYNFIIPLISGLITLIASFFIAIYKSRSEFKKMAKQLEEKYTIELYNKRLNSYPEMFKILTDESNKIEKGIRRIDDLTQFQAKYDSWLSNNAILLTPSTGKILWGYHHYLTVTFDVEKKTKLSENEWKDIRNIHNTIGKFLRAELGVFETQPAGIPSLDRPYVIELLKKLDSKSKAHKEYFQK